ncbi:CP2 transcription factor-domain-containing protein [Aspergillus germanicus]
MDSNMLSKDPYLGPQADLFINAGPDSNAVCGQVSYTPQPSQGFAIAPNDHTPNPAMTMMDSYSPQYMLSYNHLPGSHFTNLCSSSVAHPVSDLNINSQNTMTTPSPYRPSPHSPMAHNATSDSGRPASRPLLPAPARPHKQQIEVIEKNATYSTSSPSRYRVVLRAPTTMMTNEPEPAVTYLNRGQEYRLTITDTDPPAHPKDRFYARYRAHVAISFHREDQRSDPDAHWRLWRAARGSSSYGEGQDHEEGEGSGSGSPYAIELCPDKVQPAGTALNNGAIDMDSQQNVQLETSSFNGFCILWSCSRAETGTSGLPLPECTITVRFNFLTTDFCHYKGVKGFPVRLCAKTEILSDNLRKSPPVPALEDAEVYYCKVNLFRMYGAERKLATDATGVRKAREKVCKEIHKRQPKPGTEASGKQPTAAYHRNQMRIIEKLQEKLLSLQAMLSSARPVTVFSLRGDASDIPDLSTDVHSTQYEYSSASDAHYQSTIGGIDRQGEPSSSSSSTISYPWGTDVLLGSENPSPSGSQDETSSDRHAVKVPRKSFDDPIWRYIEVLDIDPTYKPPTRQQSTSVACFYIGFAGPGMTFETQVDYHIAVYLTELTTHSLIEGISKKLGIDPRRVWRVLLLRGDSVQVVDDSVVCGIPDGQDMLAEISETWAFDGTSENPIEIKLRY